jgi:hypothetical protein
VEERAEGEVKVNKRNRGEKSETISDNNKITVKK